MAEEIAIEEAKAEENPESQAELPVKDTLIRSRSVSLSRVPQ